MRRGRRPSYYAGSETSGTANAAVTDLILTSTTISDTSSIGTVVGAILAPGAHPTPTYTITADPDNKFDIQGTTLVIDQLLDAAASASHLVTIQADNGVGALYSEQFSITVTTPAPLGDFAMEDFSSPDFFTG